MELSLLWGAAAVDAAEFGLCVLWGSHPCLDWWVDFAVALSPWGMESGACWQLELALWRCKTRRAEGKMSPIRAAGEESSRRVLADGWLVYICCPMSSWLHTPQNQKGSYWCIQHCLSVSQDMLLGYLSSSSSP